MTKRKAKRMRPLMAARHNMAATKPSATLPAAGPAMDFPVASLPGGKLGAYDTQAPFEWQDVFDELKEPVFVHDREFRILRCNAAYAACAGMPMEAIIGKPYWQVFPKTGGPLGHCVDALDAQLPAEKSELTAAAGQVFLSHDITTHRASGEFWYSRHVMENLTTRKQRDDEQRARHAAADAIVDGMPGLLMVVDSNNRVVRWNAGLQASTGRLGDQLQGADVLSLVVDADREDMAAKLREAFASGHAEGNLRLESCGPDAESCIFAAHRFEVAGRPYVACIGFGKLVAQQLERTLTAEKLLSDSVIESAPGPYYMIDQQGSLVRWNRHLRELTGLTDEQLRGSSMLSLIHEDDRVLASAKMLSVLAMGYAQMEVRMPTPEFGVRVFLKTARRVEVGGIPYVAGFCVDVTERKEAEDALARQKAFADALVDSVPGAFYVVDKQGNYCAWNSYMNRLTGLSDQGLRQRTSLLTFHEQDRPFAAATMKQAFETGYAQAELRVPTRDRGVRLFSITMRRFEVGDATYLVGVGADATDRRARMQELETEARTDALTHVPNRTHFLSLAAQEFARARRYDHPLSLWMLDVDRFKAVNDTYGHHAGDQILQALGAICRQTLRDWDIMGRMGGAEFAVLLPETDATQALLVAERLRQQVAAADLQFQPGMSVHLTISIGIATIRDEDKDIEPSLDRAEHALSEAKRTGRDKVCVADDHVPESAM